MVLSLSTAFAQTEAYSGSDGDGAKITIANASKGETYKVVKLFDATVSSDGTKIAYQSTAAIPSTLTNFFEKDSENNVTLKRIADSNGKNPGDDGYVDTFYTLTETDFATIKTWADGQTATASAQSDGTALEFTGLPYGYYIVVSSQGATVTVNSTKPNATIYDKNTTTITAKKTVEKDSYSIGDTVKYTSEFETTNYGGSGSTSKQVIQYVISDTLPEFLSNVRVTKLTIGGTDYKVSEAYPQFDSNKKITIPWATEDAGSNPKTFTNIYANGAKIVLEYEAVLTSTVNFNTDNKNVVSIQPFTAKDDGTHEPYDEPISAHDEIKTYAAALKKTDGSNPLPGATFTIKGLTVTGSDGIYTVVSYDPSSDTQSAELATDANGKLYVLGLASGVDLTVTEYKAPDGYNKLTAPKSGMTAQLLTEKVYNMTGTIYYDADGNVVKTTTTTTSETITDNNLDDLDAAALEIVNQQGTELPSTGGIGTTLFYVVGIVLVLGAAAVIIARRKAEQE